MLRKSSGIIVIILLTSMFFIGRVQASEYPAKGIDVSSYQHPNGAGINWKSVRAGGYTFAFIKDTEGTYYVNPYYASDLKTARSAGLKVNSYVFANPHQSTGKQEADYLLNHGGATGIPILDIEWNPYGQTCYNKTPAQLISWINQFDNEIKTRTGGYPSINTPASWWDECLAGSSTFSNRWLWLENSTHIATSKPVMPKGWSTWRWWQDNQRGYVSGIRGAVDIDVLHP